MLQVVNSILIICLGNLFQKIHLKYPLFSILMNYIVEHNKNLSPKTLIFHPLTVLTVALVAALLFAAVSYVTFTGDLRDLLVYYFAPIAVPFIAYLFDRAQRWREVRWWI